LALALLLTLALPPSHVSAGLSESQLRAAVLISPLLAWGVALGGLCGLLGMSRRVWLVRVSTGLALLPINGAALATAVLGKAAGGGVGVLWLTVPWSLLTLYSVLQPAQDVRND
jgi:hypothetical protein